MIETLKFGRKPFYVDAIRVTESNMTEIAEWAQGEVQTDSEGTFVKVHVHRPLNERQTRAFAGDWVLYAGTGFKVYTNKAFYACFEQTSADVTVQTGPAKIQPDYNVKDLLDKAFSSEERKARSTKQVEAPVEKPQPNIAAMSGEKLGLRAWKAHIEELGAEINLPEPDLSKYAGIESVFTDAPVDDPTYSFDTGTFEAPDSAEEALKEL